jgi:hypothetical protein
MSGENEISLQWQVSGTMPKEKFPLLQIYFKIDGYKYILESVHASKLFSDPEDSENILVSSLNFNCKESINGKIVIEFGENVPFTFDVVKDNLESAALAKEMVNNRFMNLTFPKEFSLGQNFPNPFNPITQISYQLPKDCDISLHIFNAKGQLVSELVDDHKEAGRYQIVFNGSHLASGIYFYRLIAGNFSEVKRMLLIK